MNNTQMTMACPSCGEGTLNLFEYSSLMALKADLGLFTIECPNCKAKISSIHPIPAPLLSEVARAAEQVGAGMGASHGDADSAGF